MKTSDKLAKGQRVQIFQDPLSQLKPEGMATLVKFCHGDEGLEHWDVKFDGERQVYQRWIAAPKNSTSKL